MHGSILPVTIPPGHTPGDLQFRSRLAVYSPPPGRQNETISHPRDSSLTTNTLFCVQDIDDDIDFRQKLIRTPYEFLFPYNSKTRRFDKNLNAFREFLERRTLPV